MFVHYGYYNQNGVIFTYTVGTKFHFWNFSIWWKIVFALKCITLFNFKHSWHSWIGWNKFLYCDGNIRSMDFFLHRLSASKFFYFIFIFTTHWVVLLRTGWGLSVPCQHNLSTWLLLSAWWTHPFYFLIIAPVIELLYIAQLIGNDIFLHSLQILHHEVIFTNPCISYDPFIFRNGHERSSTFVALIVLLVRTSRNVKLNIISSEPLRPRRSTLNVINIDERQRGIEESGRDDSPPFYSVTVELLSTNDKSVSC